MKKLFVFIFTICLLSATYAENKVPSKVKEVTVYQSGAKINSVADVRLTAGTNDIIFEKMPLDVNAQSIQVKIKGSAKLLSASFRTFSSESNKIDNSQTKVLTDSINYLTDAISRINVEYNLLNQEEELLLENQKKVGISQNNVSTSLNLTDFKELQNFCKMRLAEIKNRHLDLTFQQRKIQNLQNVLRQKLQKLNLNETQTTGEIVLQISSAVAQTCEITCIYLISNASWTPLYDIRAENTEKPLNLVSKAAIQNNSGMDWKNVKLHLSNALPFANNNRPIMNPKYIDFSNSYSYNDQKQEDVTYLSAGKTNGLCVFRGKITDGNSGEALIGANILLSNYGAVTDLDGNFSLSAPSGNYEATISFIGYNAEKRNINLVAGQQAISNIALKENNQTLNEVTVIGSRSGRNWSGNGSGAGSGSISRDMSSSASMTTSQSIMALPIRLKGYDDSKLKTLLADMQNTDSELVSEVFDVEETATVLNNTTGQIIEYATQQLAATYQFQTVPKLDPSVFLLAQIVNYGKYNLVSGTANIFYKDTYIGQSFIDTKNTNDTLLLSLGRDEDISVKRLKANDLKSETKFFGDSKKERLAFDITVKNNKNIPIEIEVLDQIPVSRQKEIVITLDEKDNATYDETYGKLTWKISVPEHKSKNIRFAFNVKSPKK